MIFSSIRARRPEHWPKACTRQYGTSSWRKAQNADVIGVTIGRKRPKFFADLFKVAPEVLSQAKKSNLSTDVVERQGDIMDSWSRDCHLKRARIHGTFDIFRSIRMCQTRRGIDFVGSHRCEEWRFPPVIEGDNQVAPLCRSQRCADADFPGHPMQNSIGLPEFTHVRQILAICCSSWV